jgi:predicted phosphodiesterase
MGRIGTRNLRKRFLSVIKYSVAFNYRGQRLLSDKNDLQHRVVQAIKAVSQELGKIPTRDEFDKHRDGLSKGTVDKAFGLWTEAVKASGLSKKKGAEKKPERLKDPELSGEAATKIIAGYHSRRTYRLEGYTKILIIGDVHFPFCDEAALSMIYAMIEKEQPSHVVQIGDLMDMLSHSRFPRSLNLMTPREELKLGKAQSVEMWKKIKAIVPNAYLTQIIGNHDSRMLKKIMEQWPEGEDFIQSAFKEIYSFDGVHTVYDGREEFYIDDIAFIHGYRSKLGDHSIYMRENVVVGHSHRGGTIFHQVNGATKWELNAGYIADPFSAALSYRAQKLHNWTAGCGIVDKYGPRFIPFT